MMREEILDILVDLEGQMAWMRESVDGLKTDVTSLKQDMDGLASRQLARGNEIRLIGHRLERIERRLDLIG